MAREESEELEEKEENKDKERQGWWWRGWTTCKRESWMHQSNRRRRE